MDQLLILPSPDGTLVFGMDWLPLIGRRTEHTAYRAARQYKATHLVLEGPQAAAVGLAVVPPIHARGGRMLNSAARNLAGLFPSGTVAMLLRIEPDVFWVAGVHEGTVVAGTDRLYCTHVQARAGLDDLKQAFPHLLVLGEPPAPETPTLEAIRAAGTAQSKLLKARGRRHRLPAPVQWFVLTLALVLLVPRLWRLAAAPGGVNTASSDEPDPVSAWREATDKARRRHVVHGVSGTRLVLDAFYRLPVKTAGWALTGARCLARSGDWDCQADYRRVGSGASNDSFLESAPGHWRVSFPSIDLARPNWTFASAAQRLDRHVPDSTRYNDRHLLSRFQAVSSAFTRLHFGKPILFPVEPPRNGHGGQIAPPAQCPRYFTRAFRAEGPLRSGSLLLPHVSSIEWKKISIVLGATRQAGLKASRIMVSFEGVLHESESSSEEQAGPPKRAPSRPIVPVPKARPG